MIDLKQFSALQKASKSSFAKQKQIVKKVMAGQRVLCAICQQPLCLFTPEDCVATSCEKSGIRCKKGCTDIQLDFV